MDKHSITGIVIIGVLLIGFMYITRPSEEQREEMQRRQDSIALARQMEQEAIEREQEISSKDYQEKDEAGYISSAQELSDEEQEEKLLRERARKYGIFANAAAGENDIFTVENDVMIIKFSAKGGKIKTVELKDYKTYYGDPLVLYRGDHNSSFGIEMIADGRTILTDDMYFEFLENEKHINVRNQDRSIIARLYADENKYIEYVYTISPDEYMLDFDINIVGLEQELAVNPYITLRWEANIPSLERRTSDWEMDNTTIHVRMERGEIEKLSERRDFDEFISRGSVHWIAFKQQFFSSVLIGRSNIDSPSVQLTKLEEGSDFLKQFNAEVSFPFERTHSHTSEFSFYFGPNSYTKLRAYDIGLENLVPLGWGIFGWVNRFVVIPIFNWLGGMVGSYGLIIFFLTLIIKVALFPLTYKSYLSSAKMRILKPQVDELSKKYPKGKEMEKQQAVMSLYRKAGASPLGGCLPILLQFPILIALFRFFPASIELRQETFLWAEDLSTYDSILELPFTIPFYGAHVSLFTLLMAASMIIMTKLTSSNQAANPNMPGMKTMMYMMPVFMVVWFNSYASGLSYYYFLANLITIIQTIIIREFIIDEKKVLLQMEEKKKKPIKKSKWQKRLEEAQKQAKARQKK